MQSVKLKCFPRIKKVAALSTYTISSYKYQKVVVTMGADDATHAWNVRDRRRVCRWARGGQANDSLAVGSGTRDALK